MSVETDKSGNHVGPDLTQYDWEYSPISGGHDGYDFRLYNYEKEVSLEVYPENNNPDEGYNLVVREIELIEVDGYEEMRSGYPVFSTSTDGGWFMEMMSAVATAVSWVEENCENGGR